jgi:hypothetical protein
MTLKYIIQVVSESTDYDSDEPENNWFILREHDGFDETIICESQYRNEIERIQEILIEKQQQLTGISYPPDPEFLCKVESHYHEKDYEFLDCDYKLGDFPY